LAFSLFALLLEQIVGAESTGVLRGLTIAGGCGSRSLHNDMRKV
jgi:hypothetical protein